MKEAVGSYFLTGIVITFIVLFTGYLCLSINMNKAYKVKNEVINIIQKNNGLNDDAMNDILDYMNRVGYRTTGNCEIDEKDGFGYDITGNRSDNNAVICVKRRYLEYDAGKVSEQFPPTAYYQVKVFFAVDLPIVRNVFTFGLRGSTKKLFYPSGSYGWEV